VTVAEHLVRVNAMAMRVRAENGGVPLNPDPEPAEDNPGTPRQRNTRIDDAAAWALRQQGMQLRGIAQRLGCSRAAVIRSLRRTEKKRRGSRT